jgi:hypothetical protein
MSELNEAAIRADERRRCAEFLEMTLPAMKELVARFGYPEALVIHVSATEASALDLRRWDGVLSRPYTAEELMDLMQQARGIMESAKPAATGGGLRIVKKEEMN